MIDTLLGVAIGFAFTTCACWLTRVNTLRRVERSFEALNAERRGQVLGLIVEMRRCCGHVSPEALRIAREAVAPVQLDMWGEISMPVKAYERLKGNA